MLNRLYSIKEVALAGDPFMFPPLTANYIFMERYLKHKYLPFNILMYFTPKWMPFFSV